MDVGSEEQGDPAARDAVLEAFHQAWTAGETLDAWVARYPTYALELTNLALALTRQQGAPPPPPAEVAAAADHLRRAMDAALGAPPDAPS
jgi:hypothetical protein